jgi:hypothetical protein
MCLGLTTQLHHFLFKNIKNNRTLLIRRFTLYVHFHNYYISIFHFPALNVYNWTKAKPVKVNRTTELASFCFFLLVKTIKIYTKITQNTLKDTELNVECYSIFHFQIYKDMRLQLNV